jgi:hypothetical protein
LHLVCEAYAFDPHDASVRTVIYILLSFREDSLFSTIDRQLKLNRRILKGYNRAGKAPVSKRVLIDEGFDPKYVTHYWKAKNGNVYLFCYEYGFMKSLENSLEKFVLVQWQPYME